MKLRILLVILVLAVLQSCDQSTFVITKVMQGDKIVHIDTAEYVKEGTFYNNIVIASDSIISDTTIQDTAKVNYNTFSDVVGLNASLTTEANMRKAYAFDNQRVFYLMDHDFHGVPMKVRFPKPCTAKCPNINQGWEDGNANWVMRMCDYSKHFKTISLDLEAIYYPDGKGGIIEKKYPNKSISLDDMDGKPYEYGKKYGELLKASMSQFADDVNLYVAVANEPHGSPNYEVITKWSKGIKDGLSGSKIKLVSQDVQNVGEDVFNGQVLYNQVKYIDTSLFDVLQTHSYTFDKNFMLTLPPEFDSPKWMSPLNEMKSMQPYIGKKELWFTEFGFDSNALGEETQAAYLVRTIVLAMRYGYSKTFAYSLLDEAMYPFKYCGLLNADGTEKKSYKELLKLTTEYKYFYFNEVVKESDGDFIYKFFDGNKDLVISWNINDKTMPRFEIK